jgi:hypothetical protein
MRTWLFWDITQRVVLIPYRSFGTTYRSNLKGQYSKNPSWILDPPSWIFDPWKWDQEVPKRRQGITSPRCVISQKTAVLIYVATEDLNRDVMYLLIRRLFINCHLFARQLRVDINIGGQERLGGKHRSLFPFILTVSLGAEELRESDWCPFNSGSLLLLLLSSSSSSSSLSPLCTVSTHIFPR